MSMGKQCIVGFSFKNKDPIYIPLDLVLCNKCHLLQLKQTTKQSLLWNEDYGYRSGINHTMRKELGSIAEIAKGIVNLKRNDIVVDIGCNDGTLLDSYKIQNIQRVGYDPSHNVISIANQLFSKYEESSYSLFVDYFTSGPYLKKYKKKAKIITAIAMFYDLNDPNTFLEDINDILDDNGLFIIQQNYLLGMLKLNAYDNILHEHLEYYSLSSLNTLLYKHNLEVFDVLENDINGGSFRTYIKKYGSSLKTTKGKDRVQTMLANESEYGILNKSTYGDFSKRIDIIGNDRSECIHHTAKNG